MRREIATEAGEFFLAGVEVAAGLDDLQTVAGEVPEAPTMFPEAAGETLAVGFAVIVTADVPVVERVHLGAVGKTVGFEGEIEAVHEAPVLVEIAFLAADAFIPNRRAVHRAELGHVHIVKIEREDKVAGGFDGFGGFAGKAENKQALGAEPGGVDLFNGFADGVEGDAGFVALDHVGRGGLDAEGNHEGAGAFELAEHFVGGVAGADGAVELHAERLALEHIAEFVNAVFLCGKKIVVEIDVMHAEPVAQRFHLLVNVGGRVELVDMFENRAVTERAAVRAAARGDHRGTPAFAVREKGEVITFGETGDFFVGGKR